MPDNLGSLQQLLGRRFSFHPPIRNVRYNEWILRRATISECWIANVHSGAEFAIPQSFIARISYLGEPVALMALRRELRSTSGKLVPVQRAVIELPRTPVEIVSRPPNSGHPAAVIGIRIESNRQRQFARRTSWVLLCGAAIFIGYLGRFG